MLETNKVKPKKVSLRYAETLTKKRRDFRWVFQSNDLTEPCELPFFPLPGHLKEQRPDWPQSVPDLCVAPIVWNSQDLNETAPGEY